MQFVDTHCHIQFPDYGLDPDEVRKAAAEEGVTRLLCVGCTLPDSEAAVAYAQLHDGVWATIGLHPHEGSVYAHDHAALQRLRQLATQPKVVAIGETGLDYYYDNSPRETQQQLLRFQLDLAQERGLPLIFHVRDAFADFWPIFDQYKGLKGVIHSFTGTEADVEHILARGLYVGLNGIMTFSKDPSHQQMMQRLPLDRILIETDAPFLTPVPFRGKICEPKHVKVTATFISELRGESLQEFAAATTHNARQLFKI